MELAMPGQTCKYAAAHSGSLKPIPAVHMIDLGTVVGEIPLCFGCSLHYRRALLLVTAFEAGVQLDQSDVQHSPVTGNLFVDGSPAEQWLEDMTRN